MLIRIVLTLTFLIRNLEALYNFVNATQMYIAYKIKYKKSYDNIEEEKTHYMNFINNLNTVTALNENSTDNITIYVLNKYADLDPAEVQHRYSINLKPYGKVRKDDDDRELLRSDRGIEINSTNLYDLNDADEIYERYKGKHVRNITKKRDRLIHYYRFVKTLVEKNRNAFEGKGDLALNDKADAVKRKDDFFY